MSITKTVQELRKRLAASTASMQGEIAGLRRQIVETRTRLERTRNAPLPLEEIRGVIPTVIREAGAWWLAQYGSGLLYGENALGSPKPARSRTLPWALTEPIPWAALAAAKPDLAEEILGNLVAAVHYEPGIRSDDRPALIAKLESELRELETAEEAMIDDAAAAGVLVQHRPEVTHRREGERAAREREERAVADRKAREAALNQEYENQRQLRERQRKEGTPSSYLSGAGGREKF